MTPPFDIDVGRYLAGLLYEHDSVALPGLGRFETRYKPAEVDRVQGKLFPPAKRLAFEDRSVDDDGKLSARVRDRFGLSQAEAERRVSAFVKEVRNAIRRREIVVFPQVGRLYEDYQHRLQFIPDSTNFNPATFGLPALHYQATLGKTEIQRADPPALREEAGAPPLARITAWARSNAIWLGALSALVFALIIYLALPEDTLGIGTETPEQVVPPERLNRPPMPQDLPVPTPDAEGPTPEEELDTEASTIAPDQPTAFFAIGLFREQENIDRLVRSIYQAGYEPFLEYRDENTLVGIQRAFESEDDLRQTLEDIRQTFAPDAFLYRRTDE